MFELLSVIVFVWLLIKAISLALKLTWDMAKIIAGILIVLALPMLIVGIAAGIMKSCIRI